MDAELRGQFDRIDARFEKVEAKFEKVETKLDRVLFGIVGTLLAYALGIAWRHCGNCPKIGGRVHEHFLSS